MAETQTVVGANRLELLQIADAVAREKAIDAEIMVFNLEKNGKEVVKKWFEYYTSLRAFDEFRWDDGYILTLLVEQFDIIKNTSIYDIPYFVTSNKVVTKTYKWKPKRNLLDIAHDTYNWLINQKKIIKKYM